MIWQFNSGDGKKGIQANPVVYDGLVYLPTPGNNIVLKVWDSSYNSEHEASYELTNGSGTLSWGGLTVTTATSLASF